MFGVDYLGISKLLVQFPAQLRFFVVGIVLYVVFDKLNSKNIYLFVFLSLVLVLLFKDNSYFKYTLYPICVGSFVIYLVYFVKLIKIKFDFSYSFYILHFPVIQLALYFGINPSNPIVSFIILFGVILLLAYFSEIYIEKKFVKIGRNILKKDRN
jgi:peptidoglycan/LPS O-acetylase OafA/YrhL